MKLLLVDDEPGIRDGLAALLVRKGHQVRTAGDLAAAQACLAGEDFDLVVTDWRLPDGDAGPLMQACPAPILAVSGHPEEVAPAPNLREVLQKPLLPRDLLAAMERVAGAAAAPSARQSAPAPERALAVDVAAAVRLCEAVLGVPATTVVDDGAFVTVRAPLTRPEDSVLPILQRLGGDLRVLAPGGAPTVELRIHRDGRPGGAVRVIAAGDPWPDVAELAIDLARGPAPDPHAFLELLDRIAGAAAAGRQVSFLNLPDHLRLLAEVSGQAAVLPKRTSLGPRIPEVLAELWS